MWIDAIISISELFIFVCAIRITVKIDFSCLSTINRTNPIYRPPPEKYENLLQLDGKSNLTLHSSCSDFATRFKHSREKYAPKVRYDGVRGGKKKSRRTEPRNGEFLLLVSEARDSEIIGNSRMVYRSRSDADLIKTFLGRLYDRADIRHTSLLISEIGRGARDKCLRRPNCSRRALYKPDGCARVRSLSRTLAFTYIITAADVCRAAVHTTDTNVGCVTFGFF